MAGSQNLKSRIDAEFTASAQKVQDFQSEAEQTYEGRQQRLKLFEKTCEQLRDVWRPKLELLAKEFGDQVKVTPEITREQRQATFDFESKLAYVQLKFSVSTDTEVRKLVLTYDLEILPILMEFQRHAQAEFPIEAVDTAAVDRWIDDRIVDFVQAYLAMSHNEYYLKDSMVVDPIAGLRFPSVAAAATIQRGNETLYFISDKTRSEFEKNEAALQGSAR